MNQHQKVKMVEFADVKWNNGLLSDRYNSVVDKGIDAMDDAIHCEENGAFIRNFDPEYNVTPETFHGEFWSDGDCYKFIEAVAAIYAQNKDEKLDQLMDKYISWIAASQCEDGYINTQVTSGLKERWVFYRNHELYNLGHLFTAASIHYRSTGKTSLLDVAKKAANYLLTVFDPTPYELLHFAFNPSQIMGLVDLYRVTDEESYLKLAEIFLNNRGKGEHGTDFNQSRTPFREEDEAVGHSVLANYLYCGACDIYAETGEKAIFDALDKIWNNMTYKKMYITGAVGAFTHGLSSRNDKVEEGYAHNYHLPSTSAYNETCANIANAMFSIRMFNVTAENKYIDNVERVVYNTLLSASNVDVTKFIYTNPLNYTREYSEQYADDPQKNFLYNNTKADERWSTFVCYCCPPQTLRTIAKLGEWAYGITEDALFIHLYGGNDLSTKFTDGSEISISQRTDFPWDENVKITINSDLSNEKTIKFRIPAWCDSASMKVNGKVIDGLKSGKYISINRVWQKGDVIELVFPLKTKLMKSHYLVEENRGQAAIMRGPIVYCLEEADLPEGVRISQVRLPKDIELKPVYKKDFLGGVAILQGEVIILPKDDDSLYSELTNDEVQEVKVNFIPYFVWNNRGAGDMSVWLPIW